MKNISISLVFVLFLLVSTDIKDAECSLLFVLFVVALNTFSILFSLKNERLTDEESLRISYERDRLIAALKAMQETNPGTLTFLPKSAAEIKKARAAWVNASALLSEIEKNDGGKNAILKP